MSQRLFSNLLLQRQVFCDYLWFCFLRFWILFQRTEVEGKRGGGDKKELCLLALTENKFRRREDVLELCAYFLFCWYGFFLFLYKVGEY